ncbi:unnamed protein product, partial [Mesorhabditis spiculigera]
MAVDTEEMPPLAETLPPLEVSPQDESPQLTRRKVIEALKMDLDELRESQPQVHVAATANGRLDGKATPLEALGMTAGDDIAATFTEEPFRHNNFKYLCCFHQIHCKAGTRYIFILGLIAICVNILVMSFGTLTLNQMVFQGIFLVLAIFVYAMMLLAMKKENEMFLIPYFIFMAINIILFVLLFISSIWALIEPVSGPGAGFNQFLMRGNQTMEADHGLVENQEDIRIVSSVMIAAALLGLVVSLWFLMTVFKYFLYLRDMKRARHPQTIVYHGDMKNVKVTELTQ